MTDRERLIEEMMRPATGMSREEAEARLVDDDLWLVHPESRFVLEGEEALAEWEQTANFANSLAEGFSAINPGVNRTTQQLLWDMSCRANAAFRRAKERAGA